MFTRGSAAQVLVEPHDMSANLPLLQRAKEPLMHAVSPVSQELSSVRVWNSALSFCASWPFWRRKSDDPPEEAATFPEDVPEAAPHESTSVAEGEAALVSVALPLPLPELSEDAVAVAVASEESAELEADAELEPELPELLPPDELTFLYV